MSTIQDDDSLGGTVPKSCGDGAPVASTEARKLLERTLERAMSSPLCCSGCGGPHRFDTSVPSVLWNRVIRGQGLPDYLCTSCVVRAFAKAGVSFTAKLYGDGFSGLPIEVRVSGHDSQAAMLINDQNNALRFAVSEAARILSEAQSASCKPQVRDDEAQSGEEPEAVPPSNA